MTIERTDNATPVAEIDMNGVELTQAIADRIHEEAVRVGGNAETIDLVIKNIPARNVPRLIVDRNEIYEALSEVLQARK